MSARPFLCVLVIALTGTAMGGDFAIVGADQTVSGRSAFPTAVEPAKVGKYPPLVKSGAGYFYDDVLEYRVWFHPERGAAKKNGNSDYFVAFAEYEKALALSRTSKGSEAPLVLVRQLQHINEPRPGIFEVIDGERIAEWRVVWLSDSKRTPGAIERFLSERRK